MTVTQEVSAAHPALPRRSERISYLSRREVTMLFCRSCCICRRCSSGRHIAATVRTITRAGAVQHAAFRYRHWLLAFLSWKNMPRLP
ncbi:hypothetical protein KCP78_02365 [Salmonella enterica subsp. enterica]|nr:hypothetical protein KCP78_02365 [Salmonella enterica subsp. enterica]